MPTPSVSYRFKISNFQSHLSSEFTLPTGFTCLVGTSNSGKSSIFRAIFALLRNQFHPSYISILPSSTYKCKITLFSTYSSNSTSFTSDSILSTSSTSNSFSIALNKSISKPTSIHQTVNPSDSPVLISASSAPVLTTNQYSINSSDGQVLTFPKIGKSPLSQYLTSDVITQFTHLPYIPSANPSPLINPTQFTQPIRHIFENIDPISIQPSPTSPIITVDFNYQPQFMGMFLFSESPTVISALFNHLFGAARYQSALRLMNQDIQKVRQAYDSSSEQIQSLTTQADTLSSQLSSIDSILAHLTSLHTQLQSLSQQSISIDSITQSYQTLLPSISHLISTHSFIISISNTLSAYLTQLQSLFSISSLLPSIINLTSNITSLTQTHLQFTSYLTSIYTPYLHHLSHLLQYLSFSNTHLHLISSLISLTIVSSWIS